MNVFRFYRVCDFCYIAAGLRARRFRRRSVRTGKLRDPEAPTGNKSAYEKALTTSIGCYYIKQVGLLGYAFGVLICPNAKNLLTARFREAGVRIFTGGDPFQGISPTSNGRRP